MEGVVGGQDLLGLLDAHEEGLTLGALRLSQMLPIGSRCSPEACASIWRSWSPAWRVPGTWASSGSSRLSRPFVAQSHDGQGGERLGDRADHELGRVGRGDRGSSAIGPVAQPRRSDVCGPDELPLAHHPALTPGCASDVGLRSPWRSGRAP